MAAPEISGMVALAQQLALQELGRRLSFDEIRSLLKSTGDPIVDGDDENDVVPNTGLTFYRADMLALAEGILAMKPAVSHTVTITNGGLVDGKNFGFSTGAAVQGLAADDFIVGSELGEIIRGGQGDDQIDGGGGDDVISGEAGNDLITPGAGDDTVDGGDGDDTVLYLGNRSAYTITFDSVSATYTVSSAGEGTDRVTKIESFKFANATVSAQSIVDTTPPTVTSFSPADEATGVAVGADVIVQFSENVERGIASIVLKSAAGTVIETFSSTSARVTISGKTLTINPALDLNPSTVYQLEFADGSIKDLSGNSFLYNSSYNFTTAAYVNSTPTGEVKISGTPIQKLTLTASNTVVDLDGLGTISYQWKADGANIAGANGATLILTQAQVGKAISVVASYTDGHGTSESVSSSAIAPVVNVNDPGSVFINGTLTAGQTLTAVAADADGLGPVSYQWFADGVVISGATTGALLVSTGQVGHAITVTVKYTDLHGTAESVSGGLGKAVDLLAYSWKAHTLLGAVDISASGHTASSSASGAASLTVGSALDLTASLMPASATSQAVNLQDAIAILKMIVGLDVNGAGKALSPYQAFAADFDANGKVELSDAIAVLKHVVGLPSPDPLWLFFNQADASVPAKANLNPGAVPALTATLAASGTTHVGLVGVLRGDVDGSYSGGGTQSLDLPYFQQLAADTGLNLAQFGVYP